MHYSWNGTDRQKVFLTVSDQTLLAPNKTKHYQK